MAFVSFEDSEREWTDLGKARMKLLGESSPRSRGQNGSPPGGACATPGSSGRRFPRRPAGAVDAESSEYGSALGVKVGSRIGLGAGASGSGAAELGHVIAFRPRERLTHILCDDGSDKWLELQGIQWSVTEEAALPRPRQGAAVGWRVSVYWPGDHSFYMGEVLDFSAETGRHFVGYEDGDSEWLRLSRAWVKWGECPPGVQHTPAGGSPAGRARPAGPSGPTGLPPPAAGGRSAARQPRHAPCAASGALLSAIRAEDHLQQQVVAPKEAWRRGRCCATAAAPRPYRGRGGSGGRRCSSHARGAGGTLPTHPHCRRNAGARGNPGRAEQSGRAPPGLLQRPPGRGRAGDAERPAGAPRG